MGVNRRDLEEPVGGGVKRSYRLRGHRMTRAVADRLAGSARVSGIGARTVSEFQGLVIVTGYVMFLVMGVLMGPVYRLMDQALLSFARDLPESLLAMTGRADMSTPEGFLPERDVLDDPAPIALILVTVVMGARALAGEEAHRTMGLLLAEPRPALAGRAGEGRGDDGQRGPGRRGHRGGRAHRVLDRGAGPGGGRHRRGVACW